MAAIFEKGKAYFDDTTAGLLSVSSAESPLDDAKFLALVDKVLVSQLEGLESLKADIDGGFRVGEAVQAYQTGMQHLNALQLLKEHALASVFESLTPEEIIGQ